MKKIILSIVAIIGFVGASFAQCTPDPLYADSTFGAWPDTITNLASGQVGVPYSEVLQFKIPSDGGEIDPALAGVPVDSAVLDDVTGLPSGLSYVCDVSSCSWLGGAQGCASITGTPTTAGTYDVTIDITGFGTFFGQPVSQPYSFTGYKIVVAPVTGIELVHKDDFKLKYNAPNPFSKTTNIEFVVGQRGNINFKVINLLGEIVYTEMITATPGTNRIEFNGGNIPNGVYVYSLSNGENIVSQRMIKNN